MPNPHHLYHFGSIVDFVDDAIIAYTDTPLATGPCNFLAPSRSWVLGKCFQVGDDSIVNSPRKGAFKSRSAVRSRRTSCTRALLLEKILKFSEFERLASHFFEHFQILSIFEPL